MGGVISMDARNQFVTRNQFHKLVRASQSNRYLERSLVVPLKATSHDKEHNVSAYL